MAPDEHVFTVVNRYVAAAILAAVEGGILPPGRRRQIANDLPDRTALPPGKMPGSTAGKMPAATVNRYVAEGALQTTRSTVGSGRTLFRWA